MEPEKRMREPPRPELSPAGDVEHLRDVLSALEFLRSDAARTVPPLFRDMILASLTFLCEAYRHVIREATASHESEADESCRPIRRTAVQ
jgi:hypothetical protein